MAFYTLLAALWQHLLPIGSVAFRTHLLASTAGALSATLVYLIVLRLIQHASAVQQSANQSAIRTLHHLPALFAGLSLAAATDIWQHSIHTNAHIITLLLATAERVPADSMVELRAGSLAVRLRLDRRLQPAASFAAGLCLSGLRDLYRAGETPLVPSAEKDPRA